MEPLLPLCVEPPVELVGARGAGEGEEAPIVRVPALGAGSVSGGERGRLVEEEETGVAVRRHRPAGPVAAAELQSTGDPALHPPLPADNPVLVVQAAPVAVHEAALRRCDQLPQRCHAVLERHQPAALVDPEHDLAELLASLEPLVCGANLLEWEH